MYVFINKIDDQKDIKKKLNFRGTDKLIIYMYVFDIN